MRAAVSKGLRFFLFLFRSDMGFSFRLSGGRGAQGIPAAFYHNTKRPGGKYTAGLCTFSHTDRVAEEREGEAAENVKGLVVQKV